MNCRIASLLLVLLPFLTSCGDPVRPDPLQAQNSDLTQVRTLLTTVLERLDELEASAVARDAQMADELAVISTAVNQISIEGGVGAGLSAYSALEGSLCMKQAWEVAAHLETEVTVRGQADGMLGVDAYGNGAKGRILGFGAQTAGITPQASAAMELQLCGKLVGEAGVESGVTSTIDATDSLVPLLDDLIRSVGTTRLTNLASTRRMNGARTAQALDALSSFSLSNMPFGGGGAATLVGALPLPGDLSGIVADPSRLFTRSAEAGQYAVDQLCGPALRVGEFADMMSAGCALRDEVPSPADVVDIVSGLDGLSGRLQQVDVSLNQVQTSVATLTSAMSTVCNRVGAMTGASLSIPARSVTILGTSYTTFPGHSTALFQGMSAPQC